MFRSKISLVVLVSSLFVQLSVAQNNTNSPYTRYGYGELSESYSGEQRAMGDVALGARYKTRINTVNPASYSAVDSMSFMFDVGTTANLSTFSNASGSTSKFTANLSYVNMQFPLVKHVGFSAGLSPYSSVGYNYSNQTTKYPNLTSDFDTLTYRTSYIGSGGLNQVFAGLSVQPVKHLSFGVNAYYMFGSIFNQRASIVVGKQTDSINEQNFLDVSSFRFRYGVQYYNTFAQKHDLALGLIYESKKGLSGMSSELTDGALIEFADTTASDKKFELPQMLGLGLYYTYNKKLSLGADYTFTQWSKALYRGVHSLNDRSKLALGLEYTPDDRSRKLFNRMSYRAGFSTSNAYYKVNTASAPNDYTLSLGLGFPVYGNAGNITMVNTSFEYGKLGSTDLLKENYFRVVLNVTFNEHWFFKTKL